MARPLSGGPCRPTGRCGRWASAWTSRPGSTADGAKVQLYDCNGTGAQQWSYDASTGDLVDLAANKCLDVTDNSSANGARAQIWSCTGSANQKWGLQ